MNSRGVGTTGAVLSWAEMSRPLYSCMDRSLDVDHMDKSVTLVWWLSAAKAIPEG